MRTTRHAWPHVLAVAVTLSLTLLPHDARAQADSSAPSYSLGSIHREASRIYTHVYKKTRLGHEHAIEGNVAGGHLRLDAAEEAGEITFDISSFRADTDGARKYIGLEGTTDAEMQRQVTQNMLGTDVLDARQYPSAVFQVKSATRMSEDSRRGLPQFRLEGTFTLHGQARPLVVTADAETKNGWTHLRGGFRIKQSDYGIQPFTKAFGTIGVADELVIYGDLWVAGLPEQLAARPKSGN